MLRARWMTLRARWVTLRARWVTLRARWVTLRARWVTQARAILAALQGGGHTADSPALNTRLLLEGRDESPQADQKSRGGQAAYPADWAAWAATVPPPRLSQHHRFQNEV
jgi:hypothetical protein